MSNVFDKIFSWRKIYLHGIRFIDGKLKHKISYAGYTKKISLKYLWKICLSTK